MNKTNETLDGVTAGFIAAVANGLSRNIDEDRMKELIGSPEKMKLLLLPLIDDSYATAVLPTILTSTCMVKGAVSFTVRRSSSGDPPTFRSVMKEAYERKYAPLSEDSAEEFCTLLMRTQKGVHGISGIFPFIRGDGELWIIGNLLDPVRLSSRKIISLDLLDIAVPSICDSPIFFKQGRIDGSDCFKC